MSSEASETLMDALFREPASATDPLPEAPAEKVVLKVSGRVTRLFFSSPEFSAGRLRTDDGKEVAFSGPLMVKIQDRVTLRGAFERHDRYGMQMKVESFEFDQNLSGRGLVELLSSHPSFRGVGIKTAQKLAEAFGAGFADAIENAPEKVADVSGKSLAEVNLWRTAWLSTKEVNQTMTWLASLGCTYRQVCRLIDALGNSCRTAIEKDPYLIISRVPGFGWKRADELAGALGIRGAAPGRVRGALLHILDQATESGSTCVARGQLIGYARRILSERGEPVEASEIFPTLDELIETEVVTSVPLPFDPAADDCQDEAVGLSDIYGKELWLRDFFRLVGGRDNPVPGLSFYSDTDSTLKSKQVDAIVTALSGQAVLITGSAGSGKTFTVEAICCMYEAAGRVVRLAAPTGKAARRLEEVTGRPAETIHRLLEWRGKFQRNAESPIDADAVIVDEVSMLDSRLGYHLFQAIDTDRTSIILVGDPNQLPPVSAGNVLRDLVRRRFIRAVELDEVVRQAGVLKEHSSAVLRGEVKRNVPPLTGSQEEGGKEFTPWAVAAGAKFFQPKDAREYILRLYREVLQEKLGFDIVQDVQLLTPRHDGPLGTEELNVELQAIVQWKLYKREVAAMRGGQRKPRPMLYDRVIQIRNNYELGVMNGSVGVVGRESPLRVNFEGGESVEYDKESAREVELAYALTVHKAQGSEFPCVISVLHSSHGFMLHRGLFYTAVTRARKTAIIVGDPGGVAQAAKKVEVDRRRTFLSVI
jgi:exodeoxyribonuclease V alpha subunit